MRLFAISGAALAVAAISTAASASCAVTLNVQNTGAAAIEVMPGSPRSGAREYSHWELFTFVRPAKLGPEETVEYTYRSPNECSHKRQFRMAYRCLEGDKWGAIVVAGNRKRVAGDTVELRLGGCS